MAKYSTLSPVETVASPATILCTARLRKKDRAPEGVHTARPYESAVAPLLNSIGSSAPGCQGALFPHWVGQTAELDGEAS
jgi:hypothetical protein